jgi:hypothetical protein
MIQVVLARQAAQFQVDQPGCRQRGLRLGQLTGIGDAQQVTQHSAGRIEVRILAGGSAHPR